jgi:hypothetical protein
MGPLRSACDLRKRVLCICLLLTIFSTQGLSQDTDEPSGEALSAATPQVSAQTQTGAAAATVAIALPPGRAGLAPGLTLSYSSLGKNGWLGGRRCQSLNCGLGKKIGDRPVFMLFEEAAARSPFESLGLAEDQRSFAAYSVSGCRWRVVNFARMRKRASSRAGSRISIGRGD